MILEKAVSADFKDFRRARSTAEKDSRPHPFGLLAKTVLARI
jgi:hypothetical protein